MASEEFEVVLSFSVWQRGRIEIPAFLLYSYHIRVTWLNAERCGLNFRGSSELSHSICPNIKSLPDLAVKQGLNGGWEFAMLSFPRWH
jgi:hypothetical protein